MLIRITATNRGPEAAPLHLLPTLWFRNTWSWDAGAPRPRLRVAASRAGWHVIEAEHAHARAGAGSAWRARPSCCSPRTTRTSSGCGARRTPRPTSRTPSTTTSSAAATRRSIRRGSGTKAAAHYRLLIGAGESATVCLRLTDAAPTPRSVRQGLRRAVRPAGARGGRVLRALLAQDGLRRRPPRDAPGLRRPAVEQAVLSLDVKRWLRRRSRPSRRRPPSRQAGRNHEWTHLYNEDVISMPDKWEYPWYAAWDLAFH